jgi:hypothetical protein
MRSSRSVPSCVDRACRSPRGLTGPGRAGSRPCESWWTPRPRPEVIYGRGKMRVWLRTQRLPRGLQAHRGPADACRGGMNGLVRGARRAPRSLAGRPEGTGSTESGLPCPSSEPYLGDGFLCSGLVRVRQRRPGHRPVLPGPLWAGNIHGEGHGLRGALPCGRQLRHRTAGPRLFRP